MQKEYIEPEIELIKFRIEDIIATSDEPTSTTDDGDDEGPILPPDPTSSTGTTDPVPTRDPDEGVIV